MEIDLPEGKEFALCLTHDVDRPFKTYQGLYYGLKELEIIIKKIYILKD